MDWQIVFVLGTLALFFPSVATAKRLDGPGIFNRTSTSKNNSVLSSTPSKRNLHTNKVQITGDEDASESVGETLKNLQNSPKLINSSNIAGLVSSFNEHTKTLVKSLSANKSSSKQTVGNVSQVPNVSRSKPTVLPDSRSLKTPAVATSGHDLKPLIYTIVQKTSELAKKLQSTKRIQSRNLGNTTISNVPHKNTHTVSKSVQPRLVNSTSHKKVHSTPSKKEKSDTSSSSVHQLTNVIKKEMTSLLQKLKLNTSGTFASPKNISDGDDVNKDTPIKSKQSIQNKVDGHVLHKGKLKKTMFDAEHLVSDEEMPNSIDVEPIVSPEHGDGLLKPLTDGSSSHKSKSDDKPKASPASRKHALKRVHHHHRKSIHKKRDHGKIKKKVHTDLLSSVDNIFSSSEHNEKEQKSATHVEKLVSGVLFDPNMSLNTDEKAIKVINKFQDGGPAKPKRKSKYFGNFDSSNTTNITTSASYPVLNVSGPSYSLHASANESTKNLSVSENIHSNAHTKDTSPSVPQDLGIPASTVYTINEDKELRKKKKPNPGPRITAPVFILEDSSSEPVKSKNMSTDSDQSIASKKPTPTRAVIGKTGKSSNNKTNSKMSTFTSFSKKLAEESRRLANNLKAMTTMTNVFSHKPVQKQMLNDSQPMIRSGTLSPSNTSNSEKQLMIRSGTLAPSNTSNSEKQPMIRSGTLALSNESNSNAQPMISSGSLAPSNTSNSSENQITKRSVSFEIAEVKSKDLKSSEPVAIFTITKPKPDTAAKPDSDDPYSNFFIGKNPNAKLADALKQTADGSTFVWSLPSKHHKQAEDIGATFKNENNKKINTDFLRKKRYYENDENIMDLHNHPWYHRENLIGPAHDEFHSIDEQGERIDVGDEPQYESHVNVHEAPHYHNYAPNTEYNDITNEPHYHQHNIHHEPHYHQHNLHKEPHYIHNEKHYHDNHEDHFHNDPHYLHNEVHIHHDHHHDDDDVERYSSGDRETYHHKKFHHVKVKLHGPGKTPEQWAEQHQQEMQEMSEARSGEDDDLNNYDTGAGFFQLEENGGDVEITSLRKTGTKVHMGGGKFNVIRDPWRYHSAFAGLFHPHEDIGHYDGGSHPIEQFHQHFTYINNERNENHKVQNLVKNQHPEQRAHTEHHYEEFHDQHQGQHEHHGVEEDHHDDQHEHHHRHHHHHHDKDHDHDHDKEEHHHFEVHKEEETHGHYGGQAQPDSQTSSSRETKLYPGADLSELEKDENRGTPPEDNMREDRTPDPAAKRRHLPVELVEVGSGASKREDIQSSWDIGSADGLKKSFLADTKNDVSLSDSDLDTDIDSLREKKIVPADDFGKVKKYTSEIKGEGELETRSLSKHVNFDGDQETSGEHVQTIQEYHLAPPSAHERHLVPEFEEIIGPVGPMVRKDRINHYARNDMHNEYFQSNAFANHKQASALKKPIDENGIDTENDENSVRRHKVQPRHGAHVYTILEGTKPSAREKKAHIDEEEDTHQDVTEYLVNPYHSWRPYKVLEKRSQPETGADDKTSKALEGRKMKLHNAFFAPSV